MPNNTQKWVAVFLLYVGTACMSAAARQIATVDGNRMIAEADCTVDRVGTAIAISAIGQPVSGVALNPPRWVAASGIDLDSCTMHTFHPGVQVVLRRGEIALIRRLNSGIRFAESHRPFGKRSVDRSVTRPVKSPALFRSYVPPGGLGVSLVMPAISNALWL